MRSPGFDLSPGQILATAFGARLGEHTALGVTYDRMSGAVGSLLLVWAGIERSARNEVIQAYGGLPKSAHNISGLLRTWESTVIAGHPAASLCPSLAKVLHAKLQGPLAVRNGICHGLIGVWAAGEDRTAALHWEINGKQHAIEWHELQASLAWLSKIRGAFSIISSASIEGLGNRAVDNPENREWWLKEYDLSLPIDAHNKTGDC